MKVRGLEEPMPLRLRKLRLWGKSANSLEKELIRQSTEGRSLLQSKKDVVKPLTDERANACLENLKNFSTEEQKRCKIYRHCLGGMRSRKIKCNDSRCYWIFAENKEILRHWRLSHQATEVDENEIEDDNDGLLHYPLKGCKIKKI